MIAILEKLKAGSIDMGPTYEKCVALWSKALAGAENLSAEDLARGLSSLQMEIESACGMDRHLGKTVTAYSGFSFLYDDRKGFGENRRIAEKLVKAFELSGASMEVKSMAAEAARIFNLDVS
jgi:hypothetical protein